MIIISNPINLAEILEIFSDLYQVKADSAALENHTGDTDETTLKSYEIPAGTLGINGAIRIKATGTIRSGAGNKTYKLKFGGTVIATLVIVAGELEVNWTLFAACHNLGAVDSQVWSAFWIQEIKDLDNPPTDFHDTGIASALDTADAQTLEITGQLSNAGDECEVRDWTIEINPT